MVTYDGSGSSSTSHSDPLMQRLEDGETYATVANALGDITLVLRYTSDEALRPTLCEALVEQWVNVNLSAFAGPNEFIEDLHEPLTRRWQRDRLIPIENVINGAPALARLATLVERVHEYRYHDQQLIPDWALINPEVIEAALKLYNEYMRLKNLGSSGRN